MNSCLFVSSQLLRWGYSLLVVVALHPRVETTIIIALFMEIDAGLLTITSAVAKIVALVMEVILLAISVRKQYN